MFEALANWSVYELAGARVREFVRSRSSIGSRVAVAVLALLAGLAPNMARGDDAWVQTGAAGQPQIQLYFFWSEKCPHCLEARPFIESIPFVRPWVRVQSLELTRHPENVRQYMAMAEALGQEASSVPAFLLCGEMYVGWHKAETTGAQLTARLDACRVRLQASGTLAPGVAMGPAQPEPPAATGEVHGEPGMQRLQLPFIGEIDPRALSLPALTVAIAALDAFNPCAFFVLLFLLSMLVHQRSRGRMLAIGGIFVLFSGLMYFAFMAAWLNVFRFLGHLAWITFAAGGVALVVGAVNVKDFFAFEKGVTLSIPESRKPDIYRRARSILNADNLPAMVGATVFLAVAANFYELLCTAGFPMVYTRLLTLNELPASAHYLYLALYNLIYVVPLAVIVLAFVRTMGARKLSEREGRLLKLLSGVMMLELGALLVIAPERLSNLGIAFALIGAAVAVTWIAARLTRRQPAV